ncbi:2839_t:CDS:2 [Funneliformis geosporum]|uniref:11300_t:CDS:1 n=1 Tax=Funneliformis geosporum TaxID=1117311 RepID=A0A9W4SI81_9GLOM|nr:2839_t:CDS:2 [Funneliformis geosporum]CAI2169463.1 11300_t:CDS:2 [Funneliformis geosporum]
MSNINNSAFPDNNRETPTTPHIQAEILNVNVNGPTTSIANHLRTKHRIIEERAEGAEIILPDFENIIIY